MLIVFTIFHIVIGITLVLIGQIDAKNNKAYDRCLDRIEGEIIRYNNVGDTVHNKMLIPTYKYTVNGVEYVRRNPVCTEQMIKKKVDISYLKENPKISYITSLGTPKGKSVPYFFIVTGVLLILTSIVYIII